MADRPASKPFFSCFAVQAMLFSRLALRVLLDSRHITARSGHGCDVGP